MNISGLYDLYLQCGMQVCTDSRRIEKNSLFIALKGEHFNGNSFALQALENGARFAVTDEGEFNDNRIYQVTDALLALQELSKLHRQNLAPRVLAVAGSNGKTTTKELIVSVLAKEYRMHYTLGNLNNQIGVPLTLLQLRPEHQISIIEMGANKAGDIAELCEIAQPELGLITNIGKEHLQGFGSMEGVAKAECELFDYLVKHDGHAFVNLDDPWLGKRGESIELKEVYGRTNIMLEKIETEPSIRFVYKGIQINSRLMGEHNLQNILATLKVAEFFHISPEHFREGIEGYIPSNNRSQWVETENKNLILLDAYNANPSSVEMALKTFSKLDGDKIVILGDMLELGKYEAEEHQNIADLCISLGFKKIYLVGKAFSLTGNHMAIEKFTEKSEAEKSVLEKTYTNCKVLIKGSRGMQMEEFIKLF